MQVLLDTCTFLWMITDSPDLSDRARKLFSNPANEVYLSAASAWEIAIKYRLGRLALPEAPDTFIAEQRERHHIAALPVAEEAALYLHRLPDIHKDPFDRMLVCQAIIHGMAILTPDEQIKRYSVRSVW